MQSTVRIILSVLFVFLSCGAPLTMAAERVTRPIPAAELVAVEGASTTYHLTDYNGRTVTAVVPSHSIADIRDSNSDGIIHATLTAIDAANNRAKVKTQAGQTLVLAVRPADMQYARVGDPIEFTLRERSR